ncbi:nucleoside hydrolase [Paenibacillus sp. 19GGS1-52]|uniref:nucleoside hydrolase n=1 Tax=Paenibacillus sp. 19GGS1-52 TaxID=2758563 RepID=UPI001EFA72DD|nr:nucleoside hydrolase [Paenibacillus sp. 19GGS1-52]ULO09434.1 nucleoside hydrolase [Paenibacillus sp. 19GGS1-52]
MTARKKVILDVDTGVDDALAIMLAVTSGQFDILGITTVSGNVSLNQATANTCKILQLLGVSAEIPVYRGASKPLVREPFFEHNVHGRDGIGGALADMPVLKEAEAEAAADFIIRQVLAQPGEVTLIMTAPLTNLAQVLQKCPELVQHTAEVIIMGGVVKGYGNVTPTAEYNMYVDPEAGKQVLQAGFERLTLVGLDVTRQALLTTADIARLRNPEIAAYVAQSTADYRQRYFERNGVQACALHDPLAVAVAMNRKWVTVQDYYVDVETRSDLCDGQTVCDFQNRLNRPPNVSVCLEVDDRAFMEGFIHSLNQELTERRE